MIPAERLNSSWISLFGCSIWFKLSCSRFIILVCSNPTILKTERKEIYEGKIRMI
nr:MAG TPA: hypothetical protein [Caudoviricetes sp.]